MKGLQSRLRVRARADGCQKKQPRSDRLSMFSVLLPTSLALAAEGQEALQPEQFQAPAKLVPLLKVAQTGRMRSYRWTNRSQYVKTTAMRRNLVKNILGHGNASNMTGSVALNNLMDVQYYGPIQILSLIHI